MNLDFTEITASLTMFICDRTLILKSKSILYSDNFEFIISGGKKCTVSRYQSIRNPLPRQILMIQQIDVSYIKR